MKLSVDFSQVEDREPIPAAAYSMVLTETKVEEGNEYPYIRWIFEVEEGAHKGYKCGTNTSLSPKALWKLRELLEAFGIPKDRLKGAFDIDPEAHIGKSVIAEISLEDYEDRKVNQIGTVRAPSKRRAAIS